ncbi:hypothetical protein QTH91_02750 [Variovorax dokdonensis]|uniref:Uncharacterized protein n=1 Tax=Variovorax dokdonensis TaxID=344883 RepID=A0ABT7N665_9BURK|nr:hypothetical protein [Variovorax dokdonensis]MDM0043390.1 hypothetical protein [Variovorax dokdonensis]
MIPALISDYDMEAFCAFLMHNRQLPLHVNTDSSVEPSSYDDYFEFSAWSQEPPVA